MEITVTDAPERRRYEVSVDGAPAGFAEYRRRGDQIVLFHTEVDDRFEGQGVGSELARRTLDDVRSAGLGVVPRCAFIAEWIERHPEYADLVVPGA